jgi:hypothetical protein
MSTQQPARNDRNESNTIVRRPPVHLRYWTARPHGLELLSRLGITVVRALQKSYLRVESVVETVAVRLAAYLRILRVAVEVRLLEARRRPAIGALGEAAYAGDDEAVKQCRSYIRALETEIESKREQTAAVRAAAVEYSKGVLAGSRATEVHGPEPRSREPRVPTAG